jgi:hypothetical protein
VTFQIILEVTDAVPPGNQTINWHLGRWQANASAEIEVIDS